MISKIKKNIFRYIRDREIHRHNLNYLFWECTTRCNLNCLHCGSDCSKNTEYIDMDGELFLSALDTIEKPADNLIVVITGGEPLLRADLEIFGKEIRKRGMRWSIVSNGHLYTKERHVKLMNAGMGALTISLDGLKESHNWLRNSKVSFDRVVDAISIATTSQRLNFDIVTCVNKRNLGELYKLHDLLIELGVKAWRLFTIIPIGRAVNNPDLQLSDEEFVQLMDFIAEMRGKGQIDVKFSCEGYVGPYEGKVRDDFFFCRAGVNIGSVLIDGSISACPNIDRSFVQGNIKTDNFYDVWKNKFEPFRNRTWNAVGICKNCSQYKYCQGNGFHNWHGEKNNPLVCHYRKF